MSVSSLKKACLGAVAVAALTGMSATAMAQDAEIDLPRTLVWTAYDLGSSGYNQAVSIGNAFKNELGVNLRILPGKNDVSRLVPLRAARADYSATGSDATYASEGMYLFSAKDWGPQPLRQVIMNVSDGSATMAVAGDAGVETMADLKGKRVAWVKGAASIANSTRGLLAFADLTWDDVQRVEVPGYGAALQAVVDGQADAAYTVSTSAAVLQIEASPRGVFLPPLPHEDEEGWERLQQVLPFFFPVEATSGPGLDEENPREMANLAYPILIAREGLSEDQNYNMTKAMDVYYDEYKDTAPGINGWALDRQRFEATLIPFTEGSIRYYEEVGVWDEVAQETHEKNLERQQMLQDAWETYTQDAPSGDAEFQEGWMKARADTLNEAGLPVIQESWSTE